MRNIKTKNSIIAFAIGLLLICATSQVSAQDENNSGVTINKRPFRDLGKTLFDKVEAKEIDLTASFTVELKGRIGKDGKFQRSTVRFTRVEGDQNITEVAKLSLEAVNDSGYLQYLQLLGSEETIVFVSQNENEFTARISAILKTDNHAKSTASAFNAMLAIAISKKEKDHDYNKDFELLKALKVNTDKNVVSISLVLSSFFCQEMIRRELSNIKAKQIYN